MIVIHLKTHSQKLYNRLFTYLVKKMNNKLFLEKIKELQNLYFQIKLDNECNISQNDINLLRKIINTLKDNPHIKSSLNYKEKFFHFSHRKRR